MKRIAILLFENVEVLDFAGPLEVFSCVNDVAPQPLTEVYTVALHTDVMQARSNLKVQANYNLQNCPEPHVLVIPGGQGVRTALAQPEIMEWVGRQAARVDRLLSVCTGALLLAKLGVLDGVEATTHHTAAKEASTLGPSTQWIWNQRFVECQRGKIITAGGVSAGIDMAFYVLEQLLGPKMAHGTASEMEYFRQTTRQITPWAPAEQPAPAPEATGTQEATEATGA